MTPIKHYKALLILLFFTLMTNSLFAAETNYPKFRQEVKVTGKNMLIPVILPNRSLAKEAQQKQFRKIQLSVFVDGQILHRQYLTLPLNPEKDAFTWGYLDMSEYVGKTAILACNSEGEQELLKFIKFSDQQGEFKEPLYSEVGRPQFHFTPKHMWNNDPNGLYYLDGLYHMSFQNSAINMGWGNMYWGHAVSKDLLHWEESSEWPRVLRSGGRGHKNRHPSMALGECFSGGAAVDVKNVLGLQKPGGPQTVIIAYTDTQLGECIAISTDGGKRFVTQAETNPAFVHPSPKTIPERFKKFYRHAGKSHGRDPKPFWHEPTESWVMVSYLMGLDPTMASGHMVFYTSRDLKSWEFASKTEKYFPEDYEEKKKRSDWSIKDFHECPDFFQLPVDGDENKMKWVLIGGMMKYQVGDFDGKTFTPDEKTYHQGMFGDMKAGQAFSNAPNGRAIYLMWSRIRPHLSKPRPPFQQGMTLPVEFKLMSTAAGLRLSYHPIKEMKNIKGKELFSIKNQQVTSGNDLVFDPLMDTIEVELIATASAKTDLITVKFGASEVKYEINSGKVKGAKIMRAPKAGEKFTMRFIIDKAQWNLFFNEGLSYMHYARMDPGKALKQFRISTAPGGSVKIDSLKVYELKSVWNK